MRDISERKTFFCPFLSLNEDVECGAREGEPYRPSEFQQKEYCITGNSRSCPFYSFAVSNGKVVAHQSLRPGGNGGNASAGRQRGKARSTTREGEL